MDKQCPLLPPSPPPQRHSNHLRASPPLQSPRYLTHRNFPSPQLSLLFFFLPQKLTITQQALLPLSFTPHSFILSFRPATTCVFEKLTRFRNLSAGSNPLRTHSEFSFSFFFFFFRARGESSLRVPSSAVRCQNKTSALSASINTMATFSISRWAAVAASRSKMRQWEK